LIFGTITFTAKKVGVANVKVTTDSVAYDVSNKNVYFGTSQSAINITDTKIIAPVAKVVATTTGVVAVATTTEDNSLFAGQEATALSALNGLLGTSTDNFTASVLGSITNGSVGYIIGILIFLGLIIWFIFWIIKKNKEDKNK
jgi:hypothetical protein